jgi:hypothetical protein
MEGMQERQLQELAIRLAKAAVMALKTKSPHAKRLRVSRKMLKQAMVRNNPRPFQFVRQTRRFKRMIISSMARKEDNP